MKTYRAILKKYKNKTLLAETALKDWKEPDTIELLGEKVIGPVLFGYVLWILREAKKKNIGTLYFLARDGYILRKIALKICDVYGMKINCRYLYCSRHSLRLPTYSLIGEEAFELLLNKSSNVTVNKLLERVGFTETEKIEICKSIGILETDQNKILTNRKYKEIKLLLKNNAIFVDKTMIKSKIAYGMTIGYLRQEGLFDSPYVAIVDSGWTGSMQRSLRQLLQAAGYKGNIIGFYFGMFSEPKEEADGEYLTWYFDAKSYLLNKVFFCNNLFEIMLSAPHGTTLTYSYDDKNYYPILQKNLTDMNSVLELNTGVLKYTDEVLKQDGLNNEFLDNIHKMTTELLKKMMVYPTKKEIRIWEKFTFSDDITDKYERAIIDKYEVRLIQQYLLLSRVFQKVFQTEIDIKNENKKEKDLFWVWGVIQCLPVYKRWWYRLNFIIGEIIRFRI